MNQLQLSEAVDYEEISFWNSVLYHHKALTLVHQGTPASHLFGKVELRGLARNGVLKRCNDMHMPYKLTLKASRILGSIKQLVE